MEACQDTRFRAVVADKVLLEARVNIAEKFGEADLLRLYQQLARLLPEFIAPAIATSMAECAALTAEKDVHVLAATLDCKAAYLLTLDRRHRITPTILGASLPLVVLTPGDFLRAITLEE